MYHTTPAKDLAHTPAANLSASSGLGSSSSASTAAEPSALGHVERAERHAARARSANPGAARSGDASDPMTVVRGLDRARWMTQFGDERLGSCNLTQIAMVGAHDACTYKIRRENPREYAPDAPDGLVNLSAPLQPAAHRFAAGWAKTQEHSMRAMLQLGVRYFDLRVSPRGPNRELWITHGLFSCPVSEVIDDVASFYSDLLQARSSDLNDDAEEPAKENLETIILDVQRLSGIQLGCGSAKIHHAFFRSLDPIAPLLLKEGQGLTTPLREFWATGTRVVVLYPCALACAVHRPKLLPRDPAFIRSQWFNRNNANVLLKELAAELTQRRNTIIANFVTRGPGAGEHPLHVLQGILSASPSDFVRMLMNPMPGTARKVEDFAKQINSRVLTLWSRHVLVPDGPDVTFDGVARPAHISFDGRNVLMLDYFTVGRDEDTGLDAVQLCYFINAQRFGNPAAPPPPPAVCATRITSNCDQRASSTASPTTAAALLGGLDIDTAAAGSEESAAPKSKEARSESKSARSAAPSGVENATMDRPSASTAMAHSRDGESPQPLRELRPML